MSNLGVHDFAVPHEHVRPTRDMVSIQMPFPPKMVGSIEIPQIFRDMAKHNVMVGRIVAMGPLAFVYKDATDKLARHDVQVGDWVMFRPFAGTQTMGGKVAGANWRYLSSFQDIIGIIPPDKMPDPATLLWDDTDAPPAPKKPGSEPVPENVRERVTVK